MTKFCKNCEAELLDDTSVCTSCATPCDDAVATNKNANKSVKKKIGKGVLIFIGTLLCLSIAVAFLWKPLLLRFAPNWYTAIVTNQTLRTLENRGGLYDVVNTIGECVEDGAIGFTANISNKLTNNDYVVDAAIKSEAKKKKWEINLQYSDSKEHNELDLGVYLDDDFIAANSKLVNDGLFYGLTYDSFAHDFRCSGLSEKLTDDQLQLYDDLIQYYDDMISDSNKRKNILEPYAQIIREYIDSIPVLVSTDTLTLSETDIKCDTISYNFDHDSLFAMLTKLVDQMEDDTDLRHMLLGYCITEEQKENSEENWHNLINKCRDAMNGNSASFRINKASGKLVFYAYQNRLVAVKLDVDLLDPLYEEVSKGAMMLSFGLDPSKNDITMEYTQTGSYETKSVLLISGVKQEGSIYTHSLLVEASIDDTKKQTLIEAVWDQQKGEVSFTLNADEYQKRVDFGLKEIKDGYEITVKDWDIKYPIEIDLEFSFQKGATIKTPKYINLDQMDMDTFEDIYIGLSGSGLSIPIIGDENSHYVRINAGLWEAQVKQLETKARCISYENNKDVVLLHVYGSGFAPIDDYARKYYTEHGYGYGDTKDGVIFVLNQSNSRCALVPFGSCVDIFTDNEVIDIVSACQRKYADGEGTYDVFIACLEMINHKFSENS